MSKGIAKWEVHSLYSFWGEDDVSKVMEFNSLFDALDFIMCEGDHMDTSYRVFRKSDNTEIHPKYWDKYYTKLYDRCL